MSLFKFVEVRNTLLIHEDATGHLCQAQKHFWLKELIKVFYDVFDPCWNLQKCPAIFLSIVSLRYYLIGLLDLCVNVRKCPLFEFFVLNLVVADVATLCKKFNFPLVALVFWMTLQFSRKVWWFLHLFLHFTTSLHGAAIQWKIATSPKYTIFMAFGNLKVFNCYWVHVKKLVENFKYKFLIRTLGKICTCFCNINWLKINVFFMKCWARNKCHHFLFDDNPGWKSASEQLTPFSVKYINFVQNDFSLFSKS